MKQFIMKLSLPLNHIRKSGLLIILFMLISGLSYGHVIVRELDNMSHTATAFLYFKYGYRHIIPLGLDHIFFVLCLFLLSPKLKPLLWQSFAFTVAHSVTLCLAVYQVFNPPVRIVEPLIALSILYVALENIYSPRLKTSRFAIVFLFGLVHGMGFAGALSEMGLPKGSFLSSVIMFNVGVEAGQVTIIALAWFLLARNFGHKKGYRKFVVIPLSALIAVTALFWIVERTLL